VNPETLTLFREVANRSSAEREEYYARNEISDVLRGEVESLLQAGERTVDSFAGHLASAAVRALLEEPVTPADASPPAASVARAVLQPEAISRYRIIRLLGRGGMADVFLARDPMLERDVAIKLIAGGLDDAVARRRFVREASAAGRLRHPNIVTIFDAGEYEGRPFTAMEYVAGHTLRTLIQRRVPLTLGRRLELVEHACAGLAHAHRAGVVHLDIKPDNMIVDDAGVLKVLDFGIARVLSSESLATRHVVGTLRYMSPEQIAGDPLDHRSDIFSLGCSLYELLTYLPAYGGSTREIVYRIAVGPVPRLRDVIRDVDPRIDEVLGRAMALEPGERYPDLAAFQTALARLRTEIDPNGERALAMPAAEAGEQTHTVAMPTASKASGSAPLAGRPRGVAAAAAAAAAVIAIAGGAWIWQSRGADQQALASPESAAAISAPAASGRTPEPATTPAATPPAPAAPDAAAAVWQRLARGDREGVVSLLRQAVSPGDRTNASVAQEVLAVELKQLADSRAAAAVIAAAANTDLYRSAEDRASAARRQAASAPVDALILVWQARDLYDRAARATLGSPVTTETQAVESVAPLPAAAAVPAPQPQSVPAPAASTPVASQPQPRSSPGPQPELVPRIVPPSTASGAAATAAEPVRTPTDAERIEQALALWSSAYEQRDVAPLAKVYPSQSQRDVDALRRSFKANAYDVEIEQAPVQVNGNVAIVRAVIAWRITPDVGGETIEQRTTTDFHFRREGTGWVIIRTAPR
jgi:serine/threonine-protein kinase